MLPDPPHKREGMPAMLRTLLSILVMIGACASSSVAEAGRTLLSSFERTPEGWHVYDYNGGIDGGGNVFYPVTWQKTGGVGNSGFVWADDSRWRIDLPEQPNSILAFILYRRWAPGDQPFTVKTSPGGELDLRNAEVSVYLRGDGLDLKGAKCYFWVFSSNGSARWHFISSPLEVSSGKWGSPQRFVLKNDETLWHRTWSPSRPVSLDEVLSKGNSSGFSFLGFSGEVTGRISMDELAIKLVSK